MKNRLLLTLIAIAAVLGSCSKEEVVPEPKIPATTTVMGAGSVHSGSIIVKLNEESSPLTKSISTSLPELGITGVKPLFPENQRFAARHKKAGLDRWHIISFNPEVPVSKAYGEFSKMGIAEIIDFVPVISAAQTTSPFNDPYLGTQWHYYKEGSDYGINLKKAWEINTGNESVIVAVLDEGIDYKHDDLKDAMWKNEAEAKGRTGYDDDGNGYVDDIYGFNFVDAGTGNGNMIGTVYGGTHGTHVAGTVGAINNNGKFGAGIAGGNGTTKGVRLMSCQTIYGESGAYIGAAFVYAADNGAVISQNSWSLKNATETPAFIIEAIDYFNTNAGMDETGKQVGPMAGGVTIFAAGNEDATVGYPAMYDGVIAVSATGPSGAKASYSNYGNWVDIAAPGGDGGGANGVFSTLPDNQYGGLQGTSMACPHVSGAAALIVSEYGGPGFTNTALKDRLLGSANEVLLYGVNAKYKDNKQLGAGLLDAYAALLPNKAPAPVDESKITNSVSSNAITINWKATSDGTNPAYGYRIYYYLEDLDAAAVLEKYGKGEIPSEYVSGEKYKEGETVSHTFKADFNKEYRIRIQALNVFGDGSELSDAIKVRTLDNKAPEFKPAGDVVLTLKAFEKRSLEFTVSDPDGHSLAPVTFTAGSAAATYEKTVSGITVAFDASKVEAGTYKAVLTATDEYGASSSINFEYTVLPNTPPAAIKSFNNLALGKGESAKFDLSTYFTDADGEKLKYSITSSDASIADYGLVDNTFTLSGRSFGESTITVTATDAKNEKVSSSFIVLVRDSNIPADIYPTQIRDNLYVRAGTDGSYTVIVTNAQGGEVFTNESVAAGPFNPYRIDASKWDAGVYSVTFKGNGSEYKTTVVKL